MHAVGDDAARDRLILVMVRIYEARHDDHALAVDDARVRLDVGPNRDDLLALDQHVGLHEIADRWIHRHDDAVLQEDAVLAAVLWWSIVIVVMVVIIVVIVVLVFVATCLGGAHQAEAQSGSGGTSDGGSAEEAAS